MSDEATRKAGYRRCAAIISDGIGAAVIDGMTKAERAEVELIQRTLAGAGAVPPAEIVAPKTVEVEHPGGDLLAEIIGKSAGRA